jgi:GMP synthase-like glutamine amidotransferase
MRVRVFQHVPFEGIGSIETWLARRAAEVTFTRMFQGDPVPGSPGDSDLLIVMGGPMGVNDERTFPWLVEEKRAILRAAESGRRVLGICLGAQLIAAALGARVYRNREKEIGWHVVRRTAAPTPGGGLGPAATHTAPARRAAASGARPSPLIAAIPDGTVPFHWHADTFDLPRGAAGFLSSEACANQAYQVGDSVVGIQFHLETTALSARALLDNCGDDLSPGRFVQAPAEMLAEPGRFSALVPIMERVLDAVAGAG